MVEQLAQNSNQQAKVQARSQELAQVLERTLQTRAKVQARSQELAQVLDRTLQTQAKLQADRKALVLALQLQGPQSIVGNTTKTALFIDFGQAVSGKLEDDAFETYVKKHGGSAFGEQMVGRSLSSSLSKIGVKITSVSSPYEFLEAFCKCELEFPSVGSCPCSTPRIFDMYFANGHYWRQKRWRKTFSLSLAKDPLFPCKFRVLEYWGSWPPYKTDGDSAYPSWFTAANTMSAFPHNPANTFVGIILKASNLTRYHAEKAKRGLLYGKHQVYFADDYGPRCEQNHTSVHGKHLLRFQSGLRALMADGVALYAGCVSECGAPATANCGLPPTVRNLGIFSKAELNDQFHRSAFYLGVAAPGEGPAALEAIANGCACLQVVIHARHEFSGAVLFFCQWTALVLGYVPC